MYCCLFLSERTCRLLRVVLQRRAASPWAASAPPWAPCRPPTCTSTPWSPSTTRSHQMSTRGLPARSLCPHPLLPGWQAPTSAAWGASPSWSLPRTGTALSSSMSTSPGGGHARGWGRRREWDIANEDGARAGVDWLKLNIDYKREFIFLWRPGSAVVLKRENWDLLESQQTTLTFYQIEIRKQMKGILLPGLSHWNMN